MKEEYFSKKYVVRRLDEKDIDSVFELCRKNKQYYRYFSKDLTKEDIKEDMYALPSGIEMDDKYYVGYFDQEGMIAVGDIIDGYPNDDTIFIGFFMLDINKQGKGIGTYIINELVDYFKSLGYKAIQLAWIKDNKPAQNFWLKNRFEIVKETISRDNDVVILAERKLID